MNTKIRIPMFIYAYFISRSKEAKIDHENNLITTIVDEETRTQEFHRVDKFETFQVIKYALIPLIAITSNIFSLTIENSVSLIVAAITLLIWPKYRLSSFESRMKVGAASFFALLLTLPLTINGMMPSGGIVMLSHWLITVWFTIAVYEIAIGIAVQEWKYMRKVYIPDMPKFMCYYFFIEEPKNELMISKIRNKSKIFAAVLATVGIVMTAYIGVVAYHKYQDTQASIARFSAEENLALRKEESDRNGSTQIIITYQKEKLDEKTQKLHNTLGIDPSYTETTTKTYPWEENYQRSGKFIFKDGKLISEEHVGRTGAQ